MDTTRTLHRTGRLLLATLATIGIATVSVGGTASAGNTQGQAILNVTYLMPAAVGQSAADALEPELFLSGSDISDTASRCTESDTATPELGSLTMELNCNLEPGREHVIGVDMLPPDHYVAFVSCRTPLVDEAIDLPDASLTPDPFTITDCDVFIEPFPTVYIDKVTTGDGPLDSTDFTLEIYDDAGTLVDGTVADPSTDVCSLSDRDDTKCAAVTLPPGDYALGEVLPDYGYDLSSASCIAEVPGERFPSPIGEFTHGEFGADTYCAITNEYLTQTVTADLVVVNDDGGTATGADFTIEVFDNSGTKVAEGPDPEPGTGNASAEFDLPIGDYTFGVAGPAGYTSSAVVTPVDVAVATEIIETGADFTTTRTQSAAGVITVDDPPAATTTTTTTTTTLPATTTTITATLPETGSSSQLPMMLIALAFLGLGGAAIITTRRT